MKMKTPLLFPLLCLTIISPALLAADIDNDGSSDVEEGYAGTSDNNANERPYWHMTFNGSANEQAGICVSGSGDVNNDGHDDILVGVRNGNGGTGSAIVYSGVDGSTLHTVNGDSNGDEFAQSCSMMGDLNNDNYDEFIVGAPQADVGGIARVYSGIDGSVLYTFSGAFGDKLGYRVSSAGDVNNDNYDDVVVGILEDEGRAEVYSGQDGTLLYTFDGDDSGDWFGLGVAGAGDVNADGYDDVIIGAWLDDNNGAASGSAQVFSGADGSVLFTFDGNDAGDRFGYAVNKAGDVNNDGYSDLIVGARQDENNGSETGSAWVFSGKDGSTLYTFYGDEDRDYFGFSVSSAGDINNDNYDDVIVGARHDLSAIGYARIFSGKDGSILYTLNDSDTGDLYGHSVSYGDFDNDGQPDVLVGALWGEHNGSKSGFGRVYLASDLLNDVDTDFVLNSAETDADNDGMPDSWETLYGLNPLSANDRYSDLDGDAIINFREYLDGTNPSVTDAMPHDLDNDFDGDLIFYDSSSGDFIYWLLENADKQSAVWITSFSGQSVKAIFDIDNDKDADVFLQNPTNSVVTVWQSGVNDSASFYGLGYQTGYSIVAQGDFDNDNDLDLLLQDSSDNIVIWILENGSKASSYWIGNWSQDIKAVADIDNDGDKDIVTDDGAGNVNVIEIENGQKVTARWLGVWSGRSVVGAGDADRDGDDDIFLEDAGDIMVVEMEGGNKVVGRWLGVWSDTQVLAIGDIDRDADIDLIQQNTSTGSVQVVEIEDANKVTARWLGTFAYTIKGAVDADNDGDIDILMQDGSDNVGIIELENGNKVGGARWLGINSSELVLFP